MDLFLGDSVDSMKARLFEDAICRKSYLLSSLESITLFYFSFLRLSESLNKAVDT